MKTITKSSISRHNVLSNFTDSTARCFLTKSGPKVIVNHSQGWLFRARCQLGRQTSRCQQKIDLRLLQQELEPDNWMIFANSMMMRRDLSDNNFRIDYYPLKFKVKPMTESSLGVTMHFTLNINLISSGVSLSQWKKWPSRS